MSAIRRVLTWVVGYGLLLPLAVHAEPPPPVDLNLLVPKMTKVIQKHYPKATIVLTKSDNDGQRIHFEFHAKKYMVQHPYRDGGLQEPVEEMGPAADGIYGDLDLNPGQYRGQAMLPQVFRTYPNNEFETWVGAPYSKKINHHLWVRLQYPPKVPKDFFKDFHTLVGSFEQHVIVDTTKEAGKEKSSETQTTEATNSDSAKTATGTTTEDWYSKRESFEARVKKVRAGWTKADVLEWLDEPDMDRPEQVRYVWVESWETGGQYVQFDFILDEAGTVMRIRPRTGQVTREKLETLTSF